MNKVDELLLKVGVPPHMKGYTYIKAALEIHDAKTMTALYWRIADQYGVNAAQVERCIRLAVEAAFCLMTPEVQEEIFGATISWEKGKLTNGAFLAVLRLYLEDDKHGRKNGG